MPVDFFIAPCTKKNGNCRREGVVCKRTVNDAQFGICDRDSGERKPAFVDVNNKEMWDVVVENAGRKDITFKAIDFCVDVFKGPAQLIKRCEGFLFYENKIIFLEIKNRMYRGWLADACEQFIETITKFKENYPDDTFEILNPVIANKCFFRVHQSEMMQKERLKAAIGVEFQIKREIYIHNNPY
jgi:hypothetical protein